MTCRRLLAATLILLLPPFIVGRAVARQVSAAVPLLQYEVVARYPHDPDAFTQGLVYAEGSLYEGTGRYGASSVRRVDLASGTVTARIDNDVDIFGEGITVLAGRIYQLTWKNHLVFVYDPATLDLLQTFALPTEGWGITHNGSEVIVSDGSSTLYFYRPDTFTEVRRVSVTDGSGPLDRLNELEYVEGHVYANRWQTSDILRIDPTSGRVTGRLDLAPLAAEAGAATVGSDGGVANGIGWDPVGRRLLVTGKYWPTLFAVRLLQPDGGDG